jgi:hypothetical protein
MCVTLSGAHAIYQQYTGATWLATIGVGVFVIFPAFSWSLTRYKVKRIVVVAPKPERVKAIS